MTARARFRGKTVRPSDVALPPTTQVDLTWLVSASTYAAPALEATA